MLTVSTNGKLISNKLQKQYLELIASGGIKERQIVSLRTAMRNKKVDANEVIKAVKAVKGGLALEASQEQKGITWLLNQWKTETGKERKNNPFTDRQTAILENFFGFSLVGFQDVSTNTAWPFYVPVYRCYDKNANYFDYCYYGKIEIL